VPFTLVHTGKYRTEDKLKTDTLQVYQSEWVWDGGAIQLKHVPKQNKLLEAQKIIDRQPRTSIWLGTTLWTYSKQFTVGKFSSPLTPTVATCVQL